VTIASQIHCDRRIGARHTAFSRASILPDQDKTWTDAGLDQVFALAHAVARSHLKLDSLTIAGLSHTIFARSTEKGHDMSHALRTLVGPLRRLRLFIQAWPAEPQHGSDYPEWTAEDVAILPAVRQQSISVFEEGHARKVLAQARELRILKLELPQWDPHGGSVRYPRLDRTLRDLHFPHLYELALSQCAAKGDWLVDFLLRHKATLRRISLVRMFLAKVRLSWRDVFTRISCQLPHLHRVNVSGEFSRKSRPPIVFGHSDPYASPSYSKAVEAFIIQGGTYPSEDEISESDTEESDDELPYGLVDHDTPLDDPKLEYESDEYDEYIED
jgi:hypothetical protein